MTRVVVTGGSGKLGRAVVDDLLAHGHEVAVVDQAPPSRGDVPSTRADLADFGQAVGAITGVDDGWGRPEAVVHLAALPAPGLRPDAALFANNIQATYNTFAAARLAGARKVVWASSETLLGLPLETPPTYLPLDEDSPLRPESSYSLSKALEEEMARQLCRWDAGLSMVGLRFSNVMDEEDYAAFPSFDADPTQRRWNAWGYVDARDGAQAVRLGLEHPGTGAEVFVVAAADTVMGRPSAELAAEQFPGVPLRREVTGTQTLLSIERARRVLGYEPAHSWRDAPGVRR